MRRGIHAAPCRRAGSVQAPRFVHAHRLVRRWLSANGRASARHAHRRLVQPWALAFLPNGDILITERGGRLRLVHDAAGIRTHWRPPAC
ncbi:MAG: hypothetical protein DMF94_23880 [Acidobacteria bacterium]|nr:MAG: hypothetical protein DMF94_23880 [Acidobacteriota bacterium]